MFEPELVMVFIPQCLFEKSRLINVKFYEVYYREYVRFLTSGLRTIL
jgi:hypothetical protein